MSDTRAGALEGVDRATPVLAVLAGAVTVASSEGDWSPLDSFIGVLLVALVAGFHAPAPRGTALRTLLMRLAFGLALSLTLLVALAWPIAALSGSPDAPLSLSCVAVFTVLALLLAIGEPRLSGLLDGAPPRQRR